MSEDLPREADETSYVHVAPLTEEAASALCTLAGSLGFDCVRIDLAGCWEKSDLLERIAAAFEFPAWFGHNWDALFDCLTDLGWRKAAGYVVVLEHAGELQESAPEAFETALAILGEAATAWQTRAVAFRAFVSARA